MKLAIWTSKFPELSETFIESEIYYLNKVYPETFVCTLKSSHISEIPVVHFKWWHPQNVLSLLVVLCTDTFKILKIYSEILSGFKNCPRPWERTKSLLLVPLACRASLVLKKQGTTHLMSHWSNVPSTVAWVCHRLNAWPWVMVLHGENLSSIWPLLKIKCHDASKVITCTQFNEKRLIESGIDVLFQGHGVDIEDLRIIQNQKNNRMIGLSVGRLVNTKGFATLLNALKILKDKNLDFSWTIVGEGPEESSLKNQCRQLDLNNYVNFKGPLDHGKVKELYITHNVFALPIQIGEDGDSDGLPNVLLEAMVHGVPVVSTSCAAVTEAITDGETGLLIASHDSEALSEALLKLANDKNLRDNLVRQAQLRVAEVFNRNECHHRLKVTLDEVFV